MRGGEVAGEDANPPPPCHPRTPPQNQISYQSLADLNSFTTATPPTDDRTLLAYLFNGRAP